jgi:hypothetical protein
MLLVRHTITLAFPRGRVQAISNSSSRHQDDRRTRFCIWSKLQRSNLPIGESQAVSENSDDEPMKCGGRLGPLADHAVESSALTGRHEVDRIGCCALRSQLLASTHVDSRLASAESSPAPCPRSVAFPSCSASRASVPIADQFLRADIARDGDPGAPTVGQASGGTPPAEMRG